MSNIYGWVNKVEKEYKAKKYTEKLVNTTGRLK